MTRIFGLAVLPAISAAVISYFGYHGIWGERGYLALNDTRTRIAAADRQLDQISDQNRRLEHRIMLLKAGSADPDLVEELARTQLMDGAPGQVAVPRAAPLQ
ncbi:MAG TPA: septum formation initiator family protein [Rhizomicrobium sp.]